MRKVYRCRTLPPRSNRTTREDPSPVTTEMKGPTVNRAPRDWTVTLEWVSGLRSKCWEGSEVRLNLLDFLPVHLYIDFLSDPPT